VRDTKLNYIKDIVVGCAAVLYYTILHHIQVMASAADVLGLAAAKLQELQNFTDNV
jgi:hypothetical protein